MRNQSAFFGCGTWRAWDSRHKLRLKFYDLSWNSPIPQHFSYWRVCRLFTNLSPGSGSVRCYLGLRAFSHPPHPVAALGWEWWQFAATREFLLIFFLCFDLLLFVLVERSHLTVCRLRMKGVLVLDVWWLHAVLWLTASRWDFLRDSKHVQLTYQTYKTSLITECKQALLLHVSLWHCLQNKL